MDKPKVSVIVPIYKVQNYLVQCIDSILNQTLKEIEVLLIDEGDIDECRAIIDMYEFGPKKDPRVRTLHENNGGYGASCNKGFDMAQGEYISIIESDDFIPSNMFEDLYNCAKNLDADVVKVPYFEYYDKTKNNPEIIEPCFWQKLMAEVPENKLLNVKDYPIFMGIHPSIWAALYKASYLKEKNIRCIEARGAGYVDNHFRTVTFSLTDKLVWLNKPYNYYRLTNENSSWANYNIGNFIDRWSAVHKFYQTQSPELYKAVVGCAIQEEYVNTFERIIKMGYKITPKQAETLKENLSYTTIESIKNSFLLKKNAKKELIKLKKNPNILDKYIVNSSAKKQNNEKYFKLFGFIPLFKFKNVKRNMQMLYLFNFIPFIKIKTRAFEIKKLYLFSFVPFASISGDKNA